MREILRPDIEDILPPRGAVLEAQGIPADTEVPARIADLVDEAYRLLSELAAPALLVDGVGADDFARIFEGEGMNEPDGPLRSIFPKAKGLALYAATLGGEVSEKIGRLFGENEFPRGSMLDAAASGAADRMAATAEAWYRDHLVMNGKADTETRVLGYSPGYCGWHVSGQGRLFERLRPGDIGITLRESFLMDPIKSVSGLLVAGPPEIHRFDPNFPFCRDCPDHGCRPRLAGLKE
ncbi:MAG: vitamin B12 dependent-methionine synthase activation domain-containing protein [Candidatus Eisenbacteria bacterium]